jgi:hypothetical protein
VGNAVLALALLPVVRNDLALTMKIVRCSCVSGLVQIADRIRAVRQRTEIRDRDAGVAHRNDRARREPDLVLLLLGERPSIYAIAGGIIVLAAIAWHSVAGEPATDMPAPD